MCIRDSIRTVHRAVQRKDIRDIVISPDICISAADNLTASSAPGSERCMALHPCSGADGPGGRSDLHPEIQKGIRLLNYTANGSISGAVRMHRLPGIPQTDFVARLSAVFLFNCSVMLLRGIYVRICLLYTSRCV